MVNFIITGRLFYKCAKLQGNGCDFFLWASDSVESRTNSDDSSWISINRNNGSIASFSRAGTSNNDWTNVSTSNIMCHCNQPTRK